MTNQEFMIESVKRDRPNLDYLPIVDQLAGKIYQKPNLIRLIHASMGMSGETGEITDTIKKNLMYDKPVDTENLKEECGDVLWYMAIMLHELGSSFEEIMEQNVAKLLKRYPNGFTEEDAIARADKNNSGIVIMPPGAIDGGGIFFTYPDGRKVYENT